MRTPTRRILSWLFVYLFSALAFTAHAQSNSGSISGVVTDPSGAVVPGATITVENPVSGYLRTAKTDATGHFQFSNLPFNPYHVQAIAPSLGKAAQDVDVRSAVPVTANFAIQVAGTFTIHGGRHDLTLSLPIVVKNTAIEAHTKFDVPYVDWGMKNPSTLFLKVDKSVQISIAAVGELQPAGASRLSN